MPNKITVPIKVRVVAPSDKKTQLAYAACRSINFSTENAMRHGGDYSLNDLLAADKLAREALGKKARVP